MATDPNICVKCGKPLSDDGIELAGEVFDRACVTFEQVKDDADRRRQEGN